MKVSIYYYLLIIDNICNITYSPSLSSLEIYIADDEEINKIVKILKDKGYKFNHEQHDEKIEFILEENLTFSLHNKQIKIKFYETKPPHTRLILSQQIEIILECLNSLKDIAILKILEKSWFCVLWSPIKSSDSKFIITSFLTYYQFSFIEDNLFIYNNTHPNLYKLNLLGVLPLRFDEQIFFNRISKCIFYLYIIIKFR
jgi:hypothetical protein